MKTIIKGAIYTNGDCLLRPHFSGNFSIVDCTQYLPKAEIKSNYSKEFYLDCIKNNLKLTYEGKDFYECEYSPYCTDNFELLSEISEIDFFDEETEF